MNRTRRHSSTLLRAMAREVADRLIDPELLRTIPQAERIVIENATHEMCVEQPARCVKAIAAFIDETTNPFEL